MKDMRGMRAVLRMCFIVFFGVCVNSQIGNATPVGYTVSTTGPTTVTSDTGLQWLSSTESVGLSYNEVLSLSAYDGYRRATETEFLDLLADYEVDLTSWAWTVVTPAQDLNSDLFHDDFGLTWTHPDPAYAYNRWNQGTLLRDGTNAQTYAHVSDLGSAGNLEIHAVSAADWGNNDTKNDRMGHWLVRDTDPVPEPATVALLGIGLVGLAGAEVRRRRKKKAVDIS